MDIGYKGQPVIVATEIMAQNSLYKSTEDSAYNIHGYKGQPVIAATKMTSKNPH